MVSCTLMCSAEPPVACVIAQEGLPKSVLVPPHGAAFCGSPRSSSISHDAGASSLKCAWVATGTSRRTRASTIRVNAFIGSSLCESGLIEGQQLAPCTFGVGLAVDRHARRRRHIAHAPAVLRRIDLDFRRHLGGFEGGLQFVLRIGLSLVV